MSGIQTVISYFDLYPLIGVKYLDYLDFKVTFSPPVERAGAHLTETGQEIIRFHKGNINKTHSHIAWDHLSNFLYLSLIFYIIVIVSSYCPRRLNFSCNKDTVQRL
jgi:hypothetical protein